MKRFFYYALMLVLVLSIFSCKPDDDNDDNNSQDTTGLAAIIPADWQAEVVDSVSTEIISTKIAVDNNKGVHILYSAGDDKYDLKYAYKPVAGTWKIQTVYSGIDKYSRFDLAVSSNNVYAVFVDDESNTKMHLSQMAIGGDAWTDKILSDSHSARYPALFVDKNDKLHISYTLANNGQYYATLDTAGIEVSDLSSSANDIVVDKDGVIHIFVIQHYTLYNVYSSDGISWTQDAVYTYDDEYLQTPSAAVDTAGNISVAISVNQLDDNVLFFYKAYNSNNFMFSKTGGNRVSYDNVELAVDLSGKQYYTTYEYSSHYCVLFAEKDKNASKWTFTNLLNDDDYRYGGDQAIAIDRDYGVHIVANGVSREVENKLYYLYRENK